MFKSFEIQTTLYAFVHSLEILMGLLKGELPVLEQQEIKAHSLKVTRISTPIFQKKVHRRREKENRKMLL